MDAARKFRLRSAAGFALRTAIKLSYNRTLFMQQPSKLDMPLMDACKTYDVGRTRAMRWIRTKRNPLRSGKMPLPSGHQGLWVNEDEFLVKLISGGKGPAYFDFFLHCLERSAEPKHVLQGILNSPSPGKDGASFYDADLARAAIKLVMETPEFLSYLTTEKALETPESLETDRVPDGGFASEVARLLGPDRGFALIDDGLDRNPDEFKRFWGLCWKEVKQGYGTTVFGPLVTERDYLHDGRPAYLNRINCKEIPHWALRSVIPFKIPSKQNSVSGALQKMDRRAAQNSELRDHLPSIVKAIQGLTPRPPSDEESASSLDPVTNTEIGMLTKQLSQEPFFIREKEAVLYCMALHTRIHRDSRHVIKLVLRGKSLSVTAGLPRSVANRIFNLSRGIKASPR